ncbi:MAG: hypothetical protein IMZ50_06545 [Candidatus Atribacteria bacterium]|nr:hypothetical protein [Candidatus Atribacteria bacterium]
MKKLLPWIVIALILAFVGLGYMWVNDQVEKKLLHERLKNSEAQNATLAGQIKTFASQVEASERAAAAILAAAEKRERWFQTQLAHVETATPQQLVDDGSRLLQATDISTDGKTVTLGLETWRRAVSIMLNEEEYRLVREPGWLKQTGATTETVARLKEQAIAYDKQVAGFEATVKELSKALGGQKRSSALEKALWLAAGAGAGLVAGHFLK